MTQKKTKAKDHNLNEHVDAEKDKAEDVPITRADLLEQLSNQIGYYEKLPDHIKVAPVSNTDLAYFMLLIYNILIRSQ
jgi:hypothetical protein